MTSTANGNVLTCIYRQYDGYLSAHGADLRNGFGDFEIVNRLSGGSVRVANGMGCLAAQVIAALKSKPGGIYIYETSADTEEYTYTVYADGHDHQGIATGNLCVMVNCYGRIIYDGPLSGLPDNVPDED